MSASLPGLETYVLTPRQNRALTFIRAHGPCTSADVGEHLRNGTRGEQWDTPNGRAVAQALLDRGLVRRVRIDGRVLWCDIAWAPEPEPSSQMGAEDEWDLW